MERETSAAPPGVNGRTALGGASLELRSMSKTFPGQMALWGVDLELRHREVHCLLGQNGSGKSTLIKILAGFHAADAGASAVVNGRPFELGSASAARDAGIRFVHQDLALVDDLDAVDNLALGSGYTNRFWLRARTERCAAARVLAELGIDLDLTKPVKQLTPSERTLLAIARALQEAPDAGQILVLDEPTAALGGHDTHHLFELIGRLRDRGGTVLYVTHRLEEVFELADRVSVLRDGRRIATVDVADLDHDGLVELIIGRTLDELFPATETPRAGVLFAARGIYGTIVGDVSFDVHAGEVVGFAGLVGSGREELPYLLTGARRPLAGQLELREASLPALRPASAIGAGIGFVPSDRKHESAIPALSVRENVTLPRLDASRVFRWLGARAERDDTLAWLHQVDVRPADPELPFSSLSGGNQQKVVLARWLRYGTEILVVDEPTQGVDVGSKAGIYQQLSAIAAAGGAVLVFSSDAEELASLCDRVVLLRAGRIDREISGAALSAAALDALLLSTQPTGTGEAGP
jgi:ribose transport system ATP-binding protein